MRRRLPWLSFLGTTTRSKRFGRTFQLVQLLANREPSYSLPLPFYGDADFHQLDLDLIWNRNWLFAGPECTIPAVGNWFTLAVGTTSLAIVRGADGAVRAFYNTCRHRGSKVCLGEQAPDFDAFAQMVEPYVLPHGLKDAKVAHNSTLIERANWKLVIENNRECYHCSGNHPELLRTLSEYDSSDDPRVPRVFADRIRPKAAEWDRQGLPHRSQNSPDKRFRVVRLPLANGTSMTMDGGPAVKGLMGNLRDADLGSVRMLSLPNSWNHLQADHTVAFRVLPLGPQETMVTTWWLVHKDAREGVDYDVDNLTRVWTATNDQDRVLAENNQAGIGNQAYEPGPYSPTIEFGVQNFIDWYTGAMMAGLTSPMPRVMLRVA